MKTYLCQHCYKDFIPVVGSFGKFCSLSCSTSYRNKIKKEETLKKYFEDPAKCYLCNNVLDFTKRKNKFCSSSCAAKISNLIERRRGPVKQEILFSTIKFIKCKKTDKWYSNRNTDGSFRKSSPYVKTEKQKYYSAARFKFNVYKFPEEFDLDLINEIGWYSCPGKKRKYKSKNLNGVSRDHIISVSYGFLHNIDPKIISHPANCRIVLQKENKVKSSNCGFTLAELKEKIKKWDQKYTERVTGIEPATNSLEG